MADLQSPAAERPLRADARRNRDALLAAAREAFATEGIDASLDDIARSAGVGSGTLYRHFPTRESLVDAAFRDSVEGLATKAEALLQEDDAGEALVTWLVALLEHVTTFHGLASRLVVCVSDASSPLHDACRTMDGAMNALADRATAQGALREGVDVSDLGTLVHGIALAAERRTEDPELARRLLRMALDGLRA
ncbi:TetR/AcrR family transcriptional regulator [Conexibacter sp. SYSU D00693]|uniref:TetR/AcrR family transcriptional regulator n=1 Tax=Conexibacter sp. SYSU D00693 TaxID=2812560 RepID=UPI00196A854B|nr:TetR/AcrR family transcriptional regulator [Conexibacter sp. SYSU D00693]